MVTILYAIIIYILLQFCISVVVSRNIKTEKDFLIAGKRLNFPLTTFSIFGTWFGAETCIGVAGVANSKGLSGTAFEPFSFAICLIIMGLFFARIIWRMNITTIADYFGDRFSASAEKIVAIILIPTSIFWASAQFKAFGELLTIAVDIESSYALWIAAIIIISYATIGGLLADAYSDVFQGIILIVGISVLGYNFYSSIDNIYEILEEIPKRKLNYFSDGSTEIVTFYGVLDFINKLCLVIFGAIISQELIARVLAAKSPQIARNATLCAGFMYIIIGVIPLSIGLLSSVLFPDLADADQVLPLLAKKYLSPTMFLLLIISLIAAILSTVNSALLSASALLCHNLIIHNLGRQISDRACLLIERIGVVIVGIVAYNFAFNAKNIYSLVLEAEEFGSAGVFICLCFGMMFKFGNGFVASSTLIIGLISSIYLQYISKNPYSFLIALAISTFTYLILSIYIYINDKYLRLS